MSEFIDILLEGMQPVYFWVYCFMALLGLITWLVVDLWNRNVDSSRTPYSFSIKFWIRDNWIRALLTIILSPIIIIIFKELTGIGITMFGAFTVGFAIDFIISKLRKLRIPIK